MMNCNFFCSNKCRNIPFNIQKVDSLSGLGIAGAAFELISCGGLVSRGITDQDGMLSFLLKPYNTYILWERSAPARYLPSSHIYNICVDVCGRIFVDGCLMPSLIIKNTPITAEFTVIKANIENGSPLADAKYALYMNSIQIASAKSNAKGQLSFKDLSPGMYELVEIMPPPGFQINLERLTVIVTQNGSVTIEGRPAEGFILSDMPNIQEEISEPPEIDIVFEGDTFVEGDGIAGSSVEVTLPDGMVVTTEVDEAGTWRVNVPQDIWLLAGDVISAVQIEQGKLRSSPVFLTVIGLIEPFLEKIFENVTSPGESAQPGDMLFFTVFVGNLGGIGSVWRSVVLTDVLVPGLTFTQGTVAIDGELISMGTDAGQYTYDSETQTLTIYVGDLASGVTKTVTFETTVNQSVSDEIINTVEAMSIEEGGEPIIATT